MAIVGYNPLTAPTSNSMSFDLACRTLGVSRRTLYYWIRSGRVSSITTSMGSRRILTASVRTLWQLRQDAEARAFAARRHEMVRHTTTAA